MYLGVYTLIINIAVLFISFPSEPGLDEKRRKSPSSLYLAVAIFEYPSALSPSLRFFLLLGSRDPFMCWLHLNLLLRGMADDDYKMHIAGSQPR